VSDPVGRSKLASEVHGLHSFYFFCNARFLSNRAGPQVCLDVSSIGRVAAAEAVKESASNRIAEFIGKLTENSCRIKRAFRLTMHFDR
jgi:hypothetical protein